MKQIKNEKGITLIALVITIIILIILAGVSINLLLGENGLITKARDGKTNYELAANEENQYLKNAEDEIDSILNGRRAKGLLLDMNGGRGLDGKTQYIIPLPENANMTEDELYDYIDANPKYACMFDFFAWYNASKAGYDVATDYIDVSTGEPINSSTRVTESSEWKIKWGEETNSPQYAAVIKTDFNGRKANIPNFGQVDCIYTYVHEYFPTSNLIETMTGYCIGENEPVEVGGFFLDPECTQPFVTTGLSEKTYNELKQLDGITVYVKWQRTDEKDIQIKGLDGTVNNSTYQNLGTIKLYKTDTYETFRQRILDKASTVVNYNIVGFNYGYGQEDGWTPMDNNLYNSFTFQDFPTTIYCKYSDTEIGSVM